MADTKGNGARFCVLAPSLHNRLRYLTEAQNSICLRAFLPLNDIELDIIAFFEAFIPVELNCRVVDEDVRTIVTADESIALRVVEPFHFTSISSHEPLPFPFVQIEQPTANSPK